MKIKLDEVSRFALAMGRCLNSGMAPRKALELSAGTAPSAALRRAVRVAIPACDRGMAISEALEPSRRLFPGFFIPVVRAGEMGGRWVEAFQLIHDHCQRLKPSLELVRNTWLYPLICILSGWLIRAGLFLYFGLYYFAWLFVRDTFLTAGLLALAVWALLRIELVKQTVDGAILRIPLVGPTQIRLSVVLFFSTFRLVYEAGGLGVLVMFDLAAQTVSNLAIRKDFLSARAVLEENGAFEDAFGEPLLLEDHLKSSIAAGALSGHLGSSLDQIIKSQRAELDVKLDLFNRIFYRLVALSVAMSIVGTLLLCLNYSPPK